MPTSSFRLCKQVADFGMYADIDVEFELTQGAGCVRVEFNPSIERRFHSSLIWGVEYAWAFAPHENFSDRDLHVKILYLDWAPADTRRVFVVYAVAQAIWKGLGIDGSRLIAISDSGRTVSFQSR